MITNRIIRFGTLAVLLSTAALIQGCNSPNLFTGTQQAAAPGSTGIYSGSDWDAALNAAMTTDSGGGGE